MVVVPEPIRAELRTHGREEAPNECCGLVVLRDGVAERYVRGRNRLESPYRYELEIDPEVWFLEDEGYELAVFHSHPETEPRPSRPSRAAIHPIGVTLRQVAHPGHGSDETQRPRWDGLCGMPRLAVKRDGTHHAGPRAEAESDILPCEQECAHTRECVPPAGCARATGVG